jgi:hypothetical protein
VWVLLGNGDGTFGAPTAFATGTHPISVAIGDLNGDGKPDLAVANNVSNSVSVLLGNGDGTFGTKTDFPTGSSPLQVAIGDVNGDGRPDLVVATYVDNTVSVLLGNGVGGFGASTAYQTGAAPASVAIADLNGDGRPDLVTADRNSNSVSVLLALETTHSALVANPNPVGQGSPLMLTANVSVVPPGSGNPTGTVSFFDGTTLLGSSSVTGGVATFTAPAQTLGHRSMSAVYNGDGKLLGSISHMLIEVVGAVGVGPEPLPRAVFLAAPWPNPARSAVTLRFGLPRDADVSLRIYDLAGRQTRALASSRFAAGERTMTWDLTDESGAPVPSGLYFVRMSAGGATCVTRVAVVSPGR